MHLRGWCAATRYPELCRLVEDIAKLFKNTLFE